MSRDLVHELDHSSPAASHAQLGTVVNELQTKLNALLAMLDTAGATVTGLGTNYAATLAVTPISQRD